MHIKSKQNRESINLSCVTYNKSYDCSKGTNSTENGGEW